MKKRIICLSVTTLLLCGCTPTVNTYTVTWLNEDGTVLEVDENVMEGTYPTYDGETPTINEDDKTYIFTFSGWSQEFAPITSDMTYTAQYTKEYIDYLVNFNDYDGSTISSKTYHYGDTIEVPANPSKPSNDVYGYTFTGWDKEVTSTCLGNATYTAQYEQYYIDYLVEFVNPDGSVISSKSYHYGDTIEVPSDPDQASDDMYDYTFKGWDKDIATTCVENVTYTAIYTETLNSSYYKSIGVTPVVDSDNKTVTYGLYPQSHVNDTVLIKKLDSLTTVSKNGWYLYENRYYAKLTAQPDQSGYLFNDGVVIKSGLTYWFKCEPITWKIIKTDGDSLTLLSDLLIDAHYFNESKNSEEIDGVTIYANNYEHSDIRSWLNGDFYNSAFALENSIIQTTTVDNGKTSMPGTITNPYLCNDTQDKVYLLSYQDYLNADYGFTDSRDDTPLRQALTTDYARANGSYCDTGEYPNCGYYWTRTPAPGNASQAIDNNCSGLTGVGYRVDYSYSSVRPAIQVSIPQ